MIRRIKNFKITLPFAGYDPLSLNPFKGIGKGKKINDPKTKEKYFHFGVEGHWKRKCLNYLAYKMDSSVTESLVIEVSLIAGTSNSESVKSGATNYICNTL